jgi:hypothetical protein
VCLRRDGEELELPILEKRLKIVVLYDLSDSREEGTEEVGVALKLD